MGGSVRIIFLVLLMLAPAAAPAAERLPCGVIERVSVHPHWAEIVRTHVTTLGRDEVPAGGVGSFIIALCSVTPDVDAETIRVESRSPRTVVHSWRLTDLPQHLGQPGRRLLEMTATLVVGENRVEIAWVTRAAGWRPEHRVRHDVEAGRLVLSTIALVEQGTGEPWDAAITADAGPSQALAPAGLDAPPAVRARVGGDGAEQRLELPDQSWPARVDYVVRPSRDPAALAILVASRPTGRALAAGSVAVHAGDRYLGRTTLPETPAGGELRVPLGPEPRLRASRREAPPARGAGASRVSLVLQSRLDVPVEVDVEEPLAADAEVLAATSRGWARRDDLIAWHVALAPGETREIVLARRGARAHPSEAASGAEPARARGTGLGR